MKVKYIMQLNRDNYATKHYTPKIIQFGGGNFLRAFIGEQVMQLNQNFAQDFGITIVRSVGASSLNAQDGLYTLITQGINHDNMEINKHQIIDVVCGEISASHDYEAFIALTDDENYQTIISNTTEAGICFDDTCLLEHKPASNFPAKVTQLLWRRYQTKGKEKAPGFQFIPCELIDNNGEALKNCILQYAKHWALGAAFIQWINECNEFYNTLVDRIVPGFPKDHTCELQKELGYEDQHMVVAEVFSLFLIEKKANQAMPNIPFHKLDNVIVTEDISHYKQQKVAILNGAHTALAPIALLHGHTYVKDTMQQDSFRKLLDNILSQEVIPFLSIEQTQAETFAQDVIRRFSNPYIQHAWHDISLNSIAKFKTRNLPQLLSYAHQYGYIPEGMGKSLAAWIIFYFGDFPLANHYPVRDHEYVIDFFNKLKPVYAQDPKQAIKKILEHTGFWGCDLSTHVEQVFVQYEKLQLSLKA